MDNTVNEDTNITRPKDDRLKSLIERVERLEEEKNNFYLKKFLDRNRFSLAILSKLNNDKTSFIFYRNSLNVNNLSFKRRVLLDSPKWSLKLVLKLKSFGRKKLYYR